jgi:hypothetical protein
VGQQVTGNHPTLWGHEVPEVLRNLLRFSGVPRIHGYIPTSLALLPPLLALRYFPTPGQRVMNILAPLLGNQEPQEGKVGQVLPKLLY